MQIVSTNVSTQPDGTATVDFNGEGGEVISVTMSATPVQRDDALIERAKEMMVQVAAFGISDEDFAEAQAASDPSAVLTFDQAD